MQHTFYHLGVSCESENGFIRPYFNDFFKLGRFSFWKITLFCKNFLLLSLQNNLIWNSLWQCEYIIELTSFLKGNLPYQIFVCKIGLWKSSFAAYFLAAKQKGGNFAKTLLVYRQKQGNYCIKLRLFHTVKQDAIMFYVQLHVTCFTLITKRDLF